MCVLCVCVCVHLRVCLRVCVRCVCVCDNVTMIQKGDHSITQTEVQTVLLSSVPCTRSQVRKDPPRNIRTRRNRIHSRFQLVYIWNIILIQVMPNHTRPMHTRTNTWTHTSL